MSKHTLKLAPLYEACLIALKDTRGTMYLPEYKLFYLRHLCVCLSMLLRRSGGAAAQEVIEERKSAQD